MTQKNETYILIDAATQTMHCYQDDILWKSYAVSTGKNGLGEQQGSECTPRGWHAVHAIIGRNYPENSVFVARKWTGELYSPALSALHPNRDWILTRIIQLDGLEPGRNRGGDVDSLSRYIYLHGTPDKTKLGVPGSRGCVRMANTDIIELAEWVSVGTRVCVQ
ncbi:MAG: L,D-transpeptidase [Legionella sp.]|nr:MAG: L,D-transpeptidase [Legionella sp.]